MTSTAAEGSFTSLVFLVPITNKFNNDHEFIRNFHHLGYDAAFISDHYGLATASEERIEKHLRRVLELAKRHGETYGRKPRLILDIEGFLLNTNEQIRKLADESEYVVGYSSAACRRCVPEEVRR